VAWRVAEELSRAPLPNDVQVVACHQLAPELASQMSQTARVLFVDATATGAAGEIKLEEVKPGESVAPFSHALTPGALLALSRELYGNSPQAFMISISGANFDHGETLSPKVEAAFTRLLALLARLSRPEPSPVSVG